MNLMVVKRFIRNSVSQVEVVVFRVHGEWENMYVVSSPKYSNRGYLPELASVSCVCLYFQGSIANVGLRDSFGIVQRFGKAGGKVEVL